MNKEESKKSCEEIFAEPVRNIIKLTIGINHLALGTPNLNGYTLRNKIVLARQKKVIVAGNGRVLPPTAIALHAQAQRKIDADAAAAHAAAVAARSAAMTAAKPKPQTLYRKGITVPGVSVATLEAESKKNIDHSRKLARNFRVANPNFIRPAGTDAHHIVAAIDWRAEISRFYIFGVNIGINDAANTNIMPRFATTIIAGMPDASCHQGIHTTTYYANVYSYLLDAAAYTRAEVCVVLETIRNELNAGIFPF